MREAQGLSDSKAHAFDDFSVLPFLSSSGIPVTKEGFPFDSLVSLLGTRAWHVFLPSSLLASLA